MRRAARLVILAWMAAACYTWGPGPSDISTLKRGRTYPQGKIVLRDGQSYMLVDVRLSQDSVAGRMKSNGPTGARYLGPFGVPLTEVATLHVAHYSAGRTIGLVVLVPVVVVGTLISILIVMCLTGACVGD